VYKVDALLYAALELRLEGLKVLGLQFIEHAQREVLLQCINAAIAEGHKHKHVLKMTSNKKASIVWSAPEATVQQCHYTAAIAWLC